MTSREISKQYPQASTNFERNGRNVGNQQENKTNN